MDGCVVDTSEDTQVVLFVNISNQMLNKIPIGPTRRIYLKSGFIVLSPFSVHSDTSYQQKRDMNK